MTNREPRDRAALERLTGSHASRRTVVQGLAWTVPVVAVASAAPAFATSCQTFTFGGASCKCSGRSDADQKGYNLSICFNCPPGQTPPPGTDPTKVTIVSVSKNSGPMLFTPISGQCGGSKLPLEVTVGDCTPLLHFNSTDSATPLFVDYYFTDDPARTIYSFRTDAPPDCTNCAPTYCCTDNTKDFPYKHVCPS